MNDAYNFVREKRPIIAPNLVFMSQLMDYETKLNNTKYIQSFSLSNDINSNFQKNPDSYMDCL